MNMQTFDEVIRLVDDFDRNKKDLPQIKIAFLRNITIDPLIPYLKLFCYNEKLGLDVYMGQYDNVMQDSLDQSSGLFKHNPDVISIILTLDNLSKDLTNSFTGLSPKRVQEKRDEVINYVDEVVKAIRNRSNALILIHSFETPVYPAYGIYDYQDMLGQNNVIRRLNMSLLEKTKEYDSVYLVDMDLLISRLGYNGYRDNRYWHIGRCPYSREGFKVIAQEYIKFIRAKYGKSKKCLVLDCDNTLWGGIVGEEGMSGIKIGNDYPGSAYKAFQYEILNLYNRGVILAICSKNNEKDVLQVLRDHPEMVLKEDHFAVMNINWEDKVSGIRSVASNLNIGMDSLVFVDDSEFEVNMVKSLLPEVETILLPKDPTECKDILARSGWFDTLVVSNEDKTRNKLYKAEIERKKHQDGFSDVKGYLKSLEMSVFIKRADKFTVPRISQLTQKTNQFNLTTKRYSEAEIQEFSDSHKHDVFYLNLNDKFGDSGLVGVAIIDFQQEIPMIDTFLLSCRVIGRGVESVLLKTCLDAGRRRGAVKMIGKYFKTAKNAQVSNFYSSNGFQVIEENSDSKTYVFDLRQQDIELPPYFSSISIPDMGRRDE